MQYFINPASFSAVFTLPCDIVDKHLKLATSSQIKVILYVLRNVSGGISVEKTANALSIPESEAEDALLFWVQCGVLGSEGLKQEKADAKPVLSAEMPSRSDVIRRGMEDERIALLLREAQLKFGRGLKHNESSLLVSLYDDHGMDVPVILLLLQHAVGIGKCNMMFIKSTAVKWLKAGVENVVEAEKLIADEIRSDLAWSVVERVFGIERRKPSDRELELSNLWINEWNMSEDMLKSAYDACVNAKTKLSMPYVAKILESWHKKGYKKPQDIKDEPGMKFASKKNDFAGYDLDLFEKMLDGEGD